MTVDMDSSLWPVELSRALQPLLAELPLDQAMSMLVPLSSGSSELTALAEVIAQKVAVPELQAAIWLYVDELERSHRVSQSIDSPTGSFWHAIMHRREGDFGNSRYWLRQTGSHPVWNDLAQVGYEPYDFLSQVSMDSGKNSPELVDMQRAEWRMLFGWCAEASKTRLESTAGSA